CGLIYALSDRLPANGGIVGANLEPDLLNITHHLSEEERLARQTARRFVGDRIKPIIRDHFAAATFPQHLVKEMGALGFFGANLVGYGCAGIGDVAYGLIMQELERGDSAIRSFASVQSGLVMYPIFAFGSDAQKT